MNHFCEGTDGSNHQDNEKTATAKDAGIGMMAREIEEEKGAGQSGTGPVCMQGQ